MSDEVVYGGQSIEVDFQIARSVSPIDWIAEYDSGGHLLYIELKFVFSASRKITIIVFWKDSESTLELGNVLDLDGEMKYVLWRRSGACRCYRAC